LARNNEDENLRNDGRPIKANTKNNIVSRNRAFNRFMDRSAALQAHYLKRYPTADAVFDESDLHGN